MIEHGLESTGTVLEIGRDDVSASWVGAHFQRERSVMNAEQTGGIVIDSVGGDLSFQAGGDIVAGNRTIINNIIQRIARELTTTPYKFLAS